MRNGGGHLHWGTYFRDRIYLWLMAISESLNRSISIKLMVSSLSIALAIFSLGWPPFPWRPSLKQSILVFYGLDYSMYCWLRTSSRGILLELGVILWVMPSTTGHFCGWGIICGYE